MAIPRYEAVMLPLLRRTAAIGDAHIRDLAAAMADEFALSSEERAVLLPSGRGVAVIRSRTGWTRSYLVQAGLLESVRRRVVRVTERGADVLRDPPPQLDNEFLARFAEFREFAARSRSRAPDQGSGTMFGSPPSSDNGSTTVETPPASSPAERLEAAERELRVALAAELLSRVRGLDPSAFEQLIVDLLVKIGYGGSHREAAERLGRSGDGGIDGVIREDALGLDAVYIQAKCYAVNNTVGSGAIREFAGSLLTRGATKGVFVTTSSFSTAAKEEARQLGSHKRVVLIDGEELARLMIEHEVGVRTVQTVRVQRLDLDAYEDEDAA